MRKFGGLVLDVSRRFSIARPGDAFVPDNGGAARIRVTGLGLILALLLMGLYASTARAEVAHYTPSFTCSSVTFRFAGFPNLPNNTVVERVAIDNIMIYKGGFSFNGPSGENTVKINVPAGHHKIKAGAGWKTNGVKGEEDIPLKGGITCAFTIEKSQEIEGSKAGFTKMKLTGKLGQTVDYQIVVANTGSAEMTFGPLKDANCEGITPSGSVEIAAGASQVYTCHHELTTVGLYVNEASVAGDEEKTSNKVEVEVPVEPPTCPRSEEMNTSNFNGTPVAAGDWVWFNSVFKPKGAESGGTVKFTNQRITIVLSNKEVITLSVPDATITFSTVTQATTEGVGGEWVTTVPEKTDKNVFLAGLAYQIPPGVEIAKASPVTWEGDFTTTNSITLQWQWAAAAYTQFTTEYNELEVKPLASTTEDKYHNGDQAGTPENTKYQKAVTGGARGGGGSNYTGSYSSTISCPNV